MFLQRSGGLVRTALFDLPQAQQVSLVDLDGDADLDLVVQSGGIGVYALAGTGAGTFGPPARVTDT